MPEQALYILVLHSFAAIVSLILAIRDRLGFLASLRWAVVGFITGLLGLVTQRRMERHLIGYLQVFQDTFLNFVLEGVAIFGIPRILK